MPSFSYNIHESYDWNYDAGPQLRSEKLEIPNTPTKTFLGFEVNSRIGIAAGLLLNSKWIEAYSKWGFDLLTYKTVRLRERACYPVPNWVFLENPEIDPQSKNLTQDTLITKSSLPDDVRSITSSVSFGMPSKSPEVWMADVERARKCLAPDQVLIVSVVASPSPDTSVEELVEDYGQLASMAKDAGAQIIEANLSCPNVLTSEGSVYLNPELSKRVSQALRRNAPNTPLLLKVGAFDSEDSLEGLLRSVAGIVDGIVLVNGVSKRIVSPDGTPAFGEGREIAGVLGAGIHDLCVDTVSQARKVVDGNKFDLELLAVGGVMTPSDAQRFRVAGASAIMMGGSPMFKPELAIEIKQAFPEL